MRPGEFYFNGRSSLDYRLVIQTQPKRKAPNRRIKSFTVTGQSGTVYQTREQRDDMALDLSMVFLSEPDDFKREAVSDLFDVPGYVDFVPYYDQNYIYRAMVTDGVTFDHVRAYKRATVVTVTLMLHPHKWLKTGLLHLPFTDGQIINNPTKLVASPVIDITATGDTTITIGGQNYHFIGLSGTTTVDSELLTATSGGQNVAHKMVGLEYPKLPPGVTTIGMSSNVTSLVIQPRFVRRVS
ncbi:hypothetical protein [Lacticaseibacillus brantae]|uniref:Phage tail protein n=1 Tax=Lacticaseibacillus brantae DSM 23927 TaxID=1423727 RepID=A0A0R2BB34_9LACO|nr:hypothetical protein [Lacticaseibacillus brantae]KRM73004.1 hypothetical protein FC34_GL000723 [Lacticaseibacillus brantae DSM 23927]